MFSFIRGQLVLFTETSIHRNFVKVILRDKKLNFLHKRKYLVQPEATTVLWMFVNNSVRHFRGGNIPSMLGHNCMYVAVPLPTATMMTSSSGNIFRSPVNPPHKGQWRGAVMFSLICAWIHGWVNNREAGDLGRHLAHYDVLVMTLTYCQLYGGGGVGGREGVGGGGGESRRVVQYRITTLFCA